MSIVLEYLTKRYGNHPVVNNVSLEIANSEFFVLLGPSGSGKSTVLRMIAGLNSTDQGRILLNGRDVTNLTPQQRDTGFVFQHYALFQHMSVGDNIEFALRVRNVSKADRKRRREELLDLVGLSGLGGRMPHQLSGGQQQRVALARALAHEPAVLLLDEPFGALDAKIRTDLRHNLKRVQREIGMTTIFVTHDQEEAFELADRMGVMSHGRLLEVGHPDELYQRPQTEFVATFLGTANLLVGESTAEGVSVGPLRFPLTTEFSEVSARQRVQVLFRPEDVALAPTGAELKVAALGEATVEYTTFAGSFERLRLRLPPIPGVRCIAPPVPYGSDSILIEATRSQDLARQFPLQQGDTTVIGVRRIHALIHPGLSFLMLTDGSPAARAALDIGAEIAQLAHARTTVLGYGLSADALTAHLQQAREKIGAGLPLLETRPTSDVADIAIAREVERKPYDLVVVGSQGSKRDLPEQLLQLGEHHVLLVPQTHTIPSRVLICVSSGEPGKEDVLFTGRLMRHLGAKTTLMTVLRTASSPQEQERAQRFIDAGARTLGLLGVPTQTKVRTGGVRDEIMTEMKTGGYDMLVMGAPLHNHDGRDILTGIAAELLDAITEQPVLIIRSVYAKTDVPRLVQAERRGAEVLL